MGPAGWLQLSSTHQKRMCDHYSEGLHSSLNAQVAPTGLATCQWQVLVRCVSVTVCVELHHIAAIDDTKRGIKGKLVRRRLFTIYLNLHGYLGDYTERAVSRR